MISIRLKTDQNYSSVELKGRLFKAFESDEVKEITSAYKNIFEMLFDNYRKSLSKEHFAIVASLLLGASSAHSFAEGIKQIIVSIVDDIFIYSMTDVFSAII